MAVNQHLNEHMSIKTTFCSATQQLIHSHISFSWQKVPTASCWLLMASKGQVPVRLWALLHPYLRWWDLDLHSPYPSLLWYWQWWSIGWPHVFYRCFINRWHWRLQHLYSETLSSALVLSTIRLALNQSLRVLFGVFSFFIPRLVWRSTRLYQKKEWARLTFPFH